jgi:hypothetical protein
MVSAFVGASQIHGGFVKGQKRVKNAAGVYQTPAYWESLLTEFGLSMERGTSHKTSYMDDEGMQVAEKKLHSTGRVLPKKTQG